MLTEFVVAVESLATDELMPIAQTVMVVVLPGVVEVLVTLLEDVTGQRLLSYSVAPPQALWNSLL